MIRTTLLAFACTLLVSACGAGSTPPSSPSEGRSLSDDVRCIEQWNDHAGAEYRDVVASSKEKWRVTIGKLSVDHPEEGSTGQGCSLLFSTKARWVSFGGLWRKDGGFEWAPGMRQGGDRQPDQQIQASSFDVLPDGRIQ